MKTNKPTRNEAINLQLKPIEPVKFDDNIDQAFYDRFGENSLVLRLRKRYKEKWAGKFL